MEQKIYAKRADSEQEYAVCARMLSENEPWKSLGRTYEYTVAKVREPEGELYVVYADDEVAGCILLEMHGTLKGFIRSFCVDSAYRSHGLGGKVLAFAEKRIFRDSTNVFVFAASFNEGAVRFYRRHGYEEIGVFRNYIEAGKDEILFRKTIGPQNCQQKENPREWLG